MPPFIPGKIALITGGASGIGLAYGLELLLNGLKGLVIADIDVSKGREAVELIAKKYKKNRAVFIKTDVTVKEEIDASFRKAVDTFNNLDIVINNAGILDDSVWEKEIAINVNAVVYGNILGFEKYLPKYKTGSEAIIVNISSIAGLTGIGTPPVYTATKHAIIGLSRAYGIPEHYERTKVRVVTICPGLTDTPLLSDSANRNLGPAYELLRLQVDTWPRQKAECVAKALVM